MKETLINNFLRISKIPRESGREEKIADFFVSVAKENNLYYFKDENNNVLIKKKGNRNSKPLALQAHLDMVCVKGKGSNHNFEKDGIEVIIDSDKVFANNTSLGADQGVGLAMILTILEDNSLKHPDLEIVLTTEEETTFNGAVTFPYFMLESKRMINLDNSKDDSIFVGADGDICNEYIFNGTLVKNDYPSYKIKIFGFNGGNSGDNIELSKSNAISAIANILSGKEIFLKSINGGTTENDIAIDCEIIINTAIDVEDLFNGYKVKIEKVENNLCFSYEDTKKIINQILILKSGYILNNSVSANLGVIRTFNDEIKMLYIIRSSNELELNDSNLKIKSLSNSFHIREVYRDSIWKEDKQSKLLKKYKEVYYSEYLCYPKEEINKGSIECSAIKKRIKDLDIICIGSNMENIHTTDEITFISSWLKIFDLLTKFLEVID